MPGLEQRTEIVDQKPFVIRAHHLINYIGLIRISLYNNRVYSPSEQAKRSRDDIESLPSGFVIKPDGSKESLSPYLSAYSQDVLGTSPESADRYETAMRKVFERFLSLPDDFPAEITENIPDHICDACAVGAHCKSLNFKAGLPEMEITTEESVDRFLSELRLLELPKPVITRRNVSFSDAKPKRSRVVKTTIGTVKKILKKGFFSEELDL